MKNCFVYCRKSSEDQCRQVQSIKDQKDFMKDLARQKGLNVKRLFIDEKSAGKPYQRPAFQKMIEAITNGEANIIVTWKIDRLSRNPVENGQISWLLQQGTIQEIITTDRNYLPNDNVLPLLVEGAMANQYIRDLSTNVKRGQRSKLERGLYPACAPYGYINEGKYKGEKTIVIDPSVFDNLQILWDLLKTKRYQIADLYRIMKTKYPLHRKGEILGTSSFYRLFNNNFYSGVFTWDKKEYLGTHQPYVKQSEFFEIQEFLKRRDKTRERSLDFEYKGLLKCGTCEACITAERKTKFVKQIQSEKEYEYYRCARHRKHIKCEEKPLSTKEIEKQLLEEVNKVSLPQYVIDFGLKMLEKRDESIGKSQDLNIKKLEDLIKKLSTELETLKNNLALESDSEIRHIIKEKYNEVKVDIRRKQEDKELLFEESEKRKKQMMNALSIIKEAEEILKDGTKELKRNLVRSLGSNWVIKDKKLLYKQNFFSKSLIKSKEFLPAQYRSFGLTKNGSAKIKNYLKLR